MFYKTYKTYLLSIFYFQSNRHKFRGVSIDDVSFFFNVKIVLANNFLKLIKIYIETKFSTSYTN